MKIILLAGVAALAVLTASPAHADEKWESNFRRCQVSKQFNEESGKYFLAIGQMQATIVLDLDDLLELQKLIPFLKKCDKFWKCVADRDAGKVKHCYYPRDLR